MRPSGKNSPLDPARLHRLKSRSQLEQPKVGREVEREMFEKQILEKTSESQKIVLTDIPHYNANNIKRTQRISRNRNSRRIRQDTYTDSDNEELTNHQKFEQYINQRCEAAMPCIVYCTLC